MLTRYILSLLVILAPFLALDSFSAVFTVTTNSDFGTGSFREALTLAAQNGSASKDFIYFNIANQLPAGRTINLTSGLPNLSSNLEIDASTQLGAKFGVSDAKIALFFQFQNLTGLKIIDVTDVEVYGLYVNNTSGANGSTFRAIDMTGSNRVKIGAAGKGNVLFGFYYSILAGDQQKETFSGNITLQDNFCGLDIDGETTLDNVRDRISFRALYGDIIIGGNSTEGNVFAQGLEINQIPNQKAGVVPILISNNKIGVNFPLNKAVLTSSGITLIGDGENSYTILDNVFATVNSGAALHVSNNGPVTILRNYIGIDKSLQIPLSTGPYGIEVSGSDFVNIGSNNPSDANYITGCKPILVDNNTRVAINKNSFFCTTNAYPMIDYSNGGEVTKIEILKTTTTTVSGTATPNSVIELFYGDQCGTCSPQKYFASTIADSKGDWVYNGIILADVIASATVNNSTSEFTRVGIDVSKMKIIQACSGNNGSIIGIVPRSSQSIKWLNEDGNVVGVDPDLLNVKAGRYKIQVFGGACNEESPYYTIKASTIAVNTTNLKITNATCNADNGSIQGISVTENVSTTTYIWRNANGLIIANVANLNNVPSGIYSLEINNGLGCSETRSFEITNSNVILDIPKVADTQLCSEGEATIVVSNASFAYNYNLYADQTSTSPILSNTIGVFKINVLNNTTFYISQFKGTCESVKVPVKVGVGLSASTIVNTFSPNGDGVNDTWNINGMSYFPKAIVQIFNRSGEKVFTSLGYQNAFDGLKDGNPLPVGVYYYVIQLGISCGPVSGSLLLVR